MGSMINGKLADRYSVKKQLIISIIKFVVGSIIGFMNQSYVITILARLVQASGGAAFIALSMIAVAKLVIPHKKPGALAMISSSIALAVGIGPLVGGARVAIFIFIYGYFSSGDFLAYKIYARRNAAYG